MTTITMAEWVKRSTVTDGHEVSLHYVLGSDLDYENPTLYSAHGLEVDDIALHDGDRVPVYVLNAATYGDYAGSTVTRSNHECLVRDYGEEVLHHWEGYGSEILSIRADHVLSEGLESDLDAMVDYMISEDHLTELEYRLEEEEIAASCQAGYLDDELGDAYRERGLDSDDAPQIDWEDWETILRHWLREGIVEAVCETATNAAFLGLTDRIRRLADDLIDGTDTVEEILGRIAAQSYGVPLPLGE